MYIYIYIYIYTYIYVNIGVQAHALAPVLALSCRACARTNIHSRDSMNISPFAHNEYIHMPVNITPANLMSIYIDKHTDIFRKE